MSFKQWLESAVRQGTSRSVATALVALAARQHQRTWLRHRARWVDLEALEPRVLLSFSGAYGLVGIGGNHGDSFNSGVAHVSITAAGHFTGAETAEANVGGDGSSDGIGPISGSIAFGADNTFSTFSGDSNGFVSADGSLAAIAVGSADNDGETGLNLLLHQGSGESQATLNGVYNTVILGTADDSDQDSGLDFTAGVASLDADGAGQVTGNITQVAQGQTGGNAFTAGPGSFNYTVGSNGQLAFSGDSGWVSNDGSIFIAGQAVQEEDDQGENGYAEIDIAVKQTSGHSAADLKGHYNIAASDRADSSNSSSGTGDIQFDGAGNFTGNWSSVSNGQDSGQAINTGPFTGTYTVSDSGNLIMSFNGGVQYTAFLNADNTFGAWATVPGDASNLETGVGVLIKAASPVLATTAGSLNYAQGSAATPIDPGLTLTDTASATINSATVKVTQNFTAAEDALNFTNQNGITGTFDNTSGTLTLSGSATIAQYQTALRSVTYQDTSASPSVLARTVAFSVTDANNNTSNAATRDITVNLFGTTSTGKTVTLTLPAGNGTTATFSLAGGGSAEVTTITNADTTKSFDLTITGATGKSAVTITSKSVGQAAGMIQLHDITVTAPVAAAALASTDSLVHAAAAAPNPLVLKSFTATNGNLVGTFEVEGAIQTIKIGEVDGGTIKIDAPSSNLNVAPLVLTIPLEIKNGSIDSAIPIKSLTTIDWIDDQASADFISAPSIGTITTTGNKKSGLRGDFQADVTGPDGATALTSAKIAGSLTGVTWSLKNVAPTIQVGGSAGNIDHPVTINAAAIKSLKVGGDLDHTTIQLSQVVDPKIKALGTLTVTGTLRNSVITSVGVVNAITLGAMDHSQLLIGDGGAVGLVSDASTFVAQPLKPNLLNFTIKGLTANQPSLTASIIDAWNIGKVSLKFVDSSEEPDPFGFSAGLIGSMSFQAQGVNGGKPITLKSLDTAADLLDLKKNPSGFTMDTIGSFKLVLV